MITIGEMKASDLEQAISLWTGIAELSFSAQFDTVERLTRFLSRNPGLSSVAKSDAVIVGAVLCGHDGRRGFIYHSGVDYSFQKQGIGRRMVERCFEMLRQEGIDSCFLFTSAANEQAQKFWKSMGFQNASHIMYHSRSI